jgi:cytochrome o ubiquinol oxidase operon protein cyoD
MTAVAHDNSHGTYKSYIIGFVLSLVLTFASYFAVTLGVFEGNKTHIIIALLALAQFFVQLVFFLHLNSEEGPRWNLVSFIFTLIITIILVIGSLWVMYHMNYHMM